MDYGQALAKVEVMKLMITVKDLVRVLHEMGHNVSEEELKQYIAELLEVVPSYEN